MPPGHGKEDGARLGSMVPSARTRENGHELEHGKFHLSIRKHFYSVQVAQVAQGLRRCLLRYLQKLPECGQFKSKNKK